MGGAAGGFVTIVRAETALASVSGVVAGLDHGLLMRGVLPVEGVRVEVQAEPCNSALCRDHRSGTRHAARAACAQGGSRQLRRCRFPCVSRSSLSKGRARLFESYFKTVIGVRRTLASVGVREAPCPV